jgi:ribosomal protein S18 acetylase RimI-like enzyme
VNSIPETCDINSIAIQPAGIEDRAALALLVPEYRHLVETGWGLVALKGEEPTRTIVGAVLLSNRYADSEQATLGIRLNMLRPWFDTELPQRLLQPARAAASEWGARRLRLLEHVPIDGPEAALFKRLGFTEADTFDTFDLDLQEAIDGWRYALDLIDSRLKGLVEYEMVPLEEHHARPVGNAWARWIGGDAEEHHDTIIRGIAGLPSAIDPRYSRIALQEGKVVGMALCAVEEEALHVKAVAVAPDSRLTGVQTRLLMEFGVPALEAGAKIQRFEAGRLQPDTQRVARRLGATLVASKICFEFDLVKST